LIVRRLLISGSLFLVLFVTGIVGYVVIEGWSFLDAFYMTVITVTTVGFQEVRPLSDEGRIFTSGLVILGVGAAFYTLTTLVVAVVEGELGVLLGVYQMRRKIEAMRNHYILCGFGRVGEEIAHDFQEREVPFVIVDSGHEAVQRAQRLGYLYVEGDATAEEVLIDAGIKRARSLLAACDSDPTNIYIVITARALNPNVVIVARVVAAASEPRMRRAGADRVIAIYRMGGRLMALSAAQPFVVDFMDTMTKGRQTEHILAELEVSERSALAGRTVGELIQASPHVTILGVRKRDGTIVVSPHGDDALELGDLVIVIGDEEEVQLVGVGAEKLGRAHGRP
jgi:voltage-gated potassium channel